MAYKSSVLVLANRTAMSIGLEAALLARVESGPASFTLLLPLGRSADAQRRAERMASRLCDVGLEAYGVAGDVDPFTAVVEIWNPARFDEIVVSTLPASTLRRLSALCDAGGALAAQAALAQLALAAGLYAGPVQGEKIVPDYGWYDPARGVVAEPTPGTLIASASTVPPSSMATLQPTPFI